MTYIKDVIDGEKLLAMMPNAIKGVYGSHACYFESNGQSGF